ncbi:MAG: response regulator [Cytophagales bacterium]|jgi:DNA-binding response OmpR family regulator|nr:response regulator [Cytophagales bacterium]
MQEKLLLIQADAAALKAMEAVLGSDYKLIGKHDGLEALEWLEKGNYADLIIADSGMPYLSSTDFIKELRSQAAYRLLPILVLSDLDQVTERNHYIQAGATDFAIKPLPKSQLRQRIRHLLETARTNDSGLRMAS